MAERPNILYLHSHDTGRMIRPFGYPVPTPNLQRLAEQGFVFRRAFSGAPTCSPSRAALLTGQSAHASGMLGLAHRGFALHDYRQHLVHTLRQAGYASTLIGMQHVAKNPAVIGYDQVVPIDRGGYGEQLQAAAVTAAAGAYLQQAPSQPFFLDVGFFETHRPFPAPNLTEDPRWCRPPTPIADTAATRQDMAGFLASARLLDTSIGSVLAALDAAGLAENTLVVCTTDHGPAFPGMKATLTDHGIGVQLMLRGPGGFRGGQVCDALVSQVDLFPTLCDLLAIPAPPWLTGTSLTPLVRGEKTEVRDAIFAEVTYHAAYEPQRAIRTNRWKYIRRFESRPGPVRPNVDASASKDLWLAHGWAEQAPAEEQLYDMILDPQEGNDRVDDPALAGVRQELRERLTRWMRQTGDLLLNGPVPAPPGAELNDPAGLSSDEPTFTVPS